jgi:hypothetical protein
MKHKEFYMGVGVGYLLEKYGEDFLHILSEYLKAKQRLAEIERARVVDVFGDEIK